MDHLRAGPAGQAQSQLLLARACLGTLALALHLETERAGLSWARWARDQVALWESSRDPGT